MQDTHSDLHFMMIAALVLVAASAVFQTVIGLNADKLGAAQSQRMFATVVAASGPASAPKVAHYAKQMRSLEVSDNGHARIRGVVKSLASRGMIIGTWGGDWKVIFASGTKFAGQRGALDGSNIKEGDYVFVEGSAGEVTTPVVAAQMVVDYTLYRAPQGTEDAKRLDVQAAFNPSTLQLPPQLPATGTMPQKLPIARPMMVEGGDANTNVAGVAPLGTFSGTGGMKSPLQKSVDQQ